MSATSTGPDMDWARVMAVVGHYPLLVFVIVGVLLLKRLPWLIAAFRVSVARSDAEAKRAREALEAIEPRWHWIWQRRG